MIDVTVITPEWLTPLLVQNGYLCGGEVAAIEISNIHKHHCFLKIWYSTGTVDPILKRMLLKVYDTEYAWGAREGIFYAEIAPLMPNAPLPRCYATVVRDKLEKTYILLEDLSSTHSATPFSMERTLDFCSWDQVLDVYLVFHTFWWEHPMIGKGDFVRSFGLGVAHEATSTDLVIANQRHFIEHAFPKWLDRDGQHFSAKWHKVCEQAIAAWSHLFLKRMTEGKALTMIHGDAHWQNVLLPHHPDRYSPVIIDWEGFTRGLGVWDLSRLLISSALPREYRQNLETTLLQRYHHRLVDKGIANYSLQECFEDYRLCLIANVLLSFDWGDVTYMTSAMETFLDWGCENLVK